MDRQMSTFCQIFFIPIDKKITSILSHLNVLWSKGEFLDLLMGVACGTASKCEELAMAGTAGAGFIGFGFMGVSPGAPGPLL